MIETYVDVKSSHSVECTCTLMRSQHNRCEFTTKLLFSSTFIVCGCQFIFFSHLFLWKRHQTQFPHNQFIKITWTEHDVKRCAICTLKWHKKEVEKKTIGLQCHKFKYTHSTTSSQRREQFEEREGEPENFVFASKTVCLRMRAKYETIPQLWGTFFAMFWIFRLYLGPWHSIHSCHAMLSHQRLHQSWPTHNSVSNNFFFSVPLSGHAIPHKWLSGIFVFIPSDLKPDSTHSLEKGQNCVWVVGVE